MAAPRELADLPYELITEIFLRLPADDPACLLRASGVCTSWRSILADPAFHRSHRARHRTPPVLGFFHVVSDKFPHYCSRFVTIDPDSRLPAGRDLPGWLVLDCHHGRALFVTPTTATGLGRRSEGILDFVVWDPLTNVHIRLPPPPLPPKVHRRNFNAAVLCAADTEGGDHLDCHRGHFHVAFVLSLPPGVPPDDIITCGSVYSSATGRWSDMISVHSNVSVEYRPCPSALVGDAIYFRSNFVHPFEYQLNMQHLSVINMTAVPRLVEYPILFMSPQGGRLGFARVEREPNFCLSLWSRETSPDGVAQWAPDRTIELEILLPDGAVQHPPRAVVVGVAEDTDVIFAAVQSPGPQDIYMIQFNSGSAKKVLGCSNCYVFPYTSFCVPVIVTTSAGKDKEPRENLSASQTKVAGN